MEIDMVRGAVVCEDDEEVKKPFWETTLGTILDIAMCSVVVFTLILSIVFALVLILDY